MEKKCRIIKFRDTRGQQHEFYHQTKQQIGKKTTNKLLWENISQLQLEEDKTNQ